jgi:beta-galactosidase
VIHNFMGATEFDHYDLAKTLDVAGWDSYPIGHAVSDERRGQGRHMRQGEPDAQALKHGIHRAVGRGRGSWSNSRFCELGGL